VAESCANRLLDAEHTRLLLVRFDTGARHDQYGKEAHRTMKRLIRSSLTALALGVAVAGSLQAQQMIRPEPLDAGHPAAIQATGFMKVMLEGDVDRLIEYAQERATPQFRDGTLAEDLRAAVALLGSPVHPYTFESVLPGPGGAVLIPLVPAAGGQPLAFLLEIGGEAPHLIGSIRQVQIRSPAPPQP
jgi:hypothetical protein